MLRSNILSLAKKIAPRAVTTNFSPFMTRVFFATRSSNILGPKPSFWRLKYDNLLLEKRGNVAFITLNRPEKLNALTFGMIRDINSILSNLCSENESPVMCFVVRAAPIVRKNIFCAGGDVCNLWRCQKQLPEPGARGTVQGDFFREEFIMNYFLSAMPENLPQVSIWNGAVFGGGVGLTLHGKFRVATENAALAMPETHIGLFPDDGTSHFYGHLPRGLGNYLALTGKKVCGGPALLRYGFATHMIPSNSIPKMLNSLIEASHNTESKNDDNFKNVKYVLDSYHNQEMLGPEDQIELHREEIDAIFGQESIKNIFEKLRCSVPYSQFSSRILEDMEKLPPTALKVALEMILRGGKVPSVGDAIVTEYRVIERLMMSGSDFYEGVRAYFIDKDKSPHWCREISDEELFEMFTPLQKKENELKLPPPLHLH